MTLLNRIRDVIEQKKANRQEPAHALLQDLMFSGCDRNEVIKELDQLRQQGKIKTGNTINDIFITINEQYHEKSNS